MKKAACWRRRRFGVSERLNVYFRYIKVYQRNLVKSMVLADLDVILGPYLSKEADASLDCP